MALQLIASIYGINSNDTNKTMGEIFGFPTQRIVIRSLVPAVSYSGVSCNSVIQLLPGGDQVTQPEYACPSTAATLITAANA